MVPCDEGTHRTGMIKVHTLGRPRRPACPPGGGYIHLARRYNSRRLDGQVLLISQYKGGSSRLLRTSVHPWYLAYGPLNQLDNRRNLVPLSVRLPPAFIKMCLLLSPPLLAAGSGHAPEAEETNPRLRQALSYWTKETRTGGQKDVENVYIRFPM